MSCQVGADSTPWCIENDLVSIRLDPKSKGGLAAFVDRQTQRNFIGPPLNPLFTIELSARGQDLVVLSSNDADSLTVDQAPEPGREILALSYRGFRGLEIGVTCTVSLPYDSSLSRWTVAIRNGTAYGVRTIRYPVIVSPAVLGDSDEDDYFVWGAPWRNLAHRPGRIVRRMVRANRLAEASGDAELEGAPRSDYCPAGQYPGVVGLQFQAYYDREAGLYVAAHDSSGSIKDFGLRPAASDDSMDISIAHHHDERPGLDFALPYETVVGTFHGDWYDAADIYKEWAHRQHWCAKRLTDRTDIPDWIKEPRPHMMIITQGNVERARGALWSAPADLPLAKFWPIRKVVPLMREYAGIFGTPVTTWLEGWERIGSPGGPVDIFPPLEGETSFRAATSRLNMDGHLCWMYATGFQWCYLRSPTGYDGRARFEREGRAMAALNDQGDIDHFVFPNGQKHFAPMCIASEPFRQLLAGNVMHLMDLGAVALQVDQQHGWFATACYSREHDHPPGYGPWMYEKTLGWIRGVRNRAKERDPDATFSQETPCEIWIQEMDIQMHRPYSVGTVDVFGYVYHEYALTYGGDDMLGLSHPEVSLMKHALVCVLGQQNLVGIGETEYDIQVEEIEHPALPLLREIFQAQRTFARDYLFAGQTLRPTHVDVRSIAVERWIHVLGKPSAQFVEMPLIVNGVFKVGDGRIGYILVNWSGSSENATVSLVRPQGEAWIVTRSGRQRVAQDEVARGRVAIESAPRSVMLIEQVMERGAVEDQSQT